MKKITLIIALFCFTSVTIFAQGVKFGHVSPEEIMELIPGFDTARTAMMEYQNGLQKEGEEMYKELQLKQQQYEREVANYSQAVRQVKEDELKAMYARIQEFSAAIEESIEQRKYELLLPFQNKIIDAIASIAKEEKFTYIFNKSLLSYYEQGEDITTKVKIKLGITK